MKTFYIRLNVKYQSSTQSVNNCLKTYYKNLQYPKISNTFRCSCVQNAKNCKKNLKQKSSRDITSFGQIQIAIHSCRLEILTKRGRYNCADYR
jgi:hypothetical protein